MDYLQDLAVCAPSHPAAVGFFILRQVFRLPAVPRNFFRRHEILFSAFYREDPANRFPGHSQGGAVSISLLHLLFVELGQFVVPASAPVPYAPLPARVECACCAATEMGMRIRLVSRNSSPAPHNPQ